MRELFNRAITVLGLTNVLRDLRAEVVENLSATCGKIAVLGFGI